MGKSSYYLTTPLYYVNAKPHIGHAYTNILADTFARFRKLRGEKVFFLTGTDEHGTKIEKISREKKMEPWDYVDTMVPQFKALWKLLNIDYDYFIRTTDENHKREVQRVLLTLEKKADIYKSSYKGWYCTPCESFWTDLQLNEGKCPDCRRDVQRLVEENYFFKLSKYQAWLIDYIQNTESFIQPEMRKNEILGFLKAPLEDLSISRPRTRLQWGIDYPNSNDDVVYVWFDALVNYITAAGHGEDAARFREWWPADAHLVGKDILRQHAVYWPIMLKALELPLPKTVVAHGWWMISGSKVSKSAGNVVDPAELVKTYGVDALRYFLLREVKVGQDGSFTEDLLKERYTTDLANDLGNVWFRFASMIEKYFESKMPPAVLGLEEVPLLKDTFALWDLVEAAMLRYDPREALEQIFQIITKANQFVEENKPWSLAKDPAKREELAKVLTALGETIVHLAVLLTAFLPDTAFRILARMKLPKTWIIHQRSDYQKLFLKENLIVEKGVVLFPKLEDAEKAKV